MYKIEPTESPHKKGRLYIPSLIDFYRITD